MFACLFLLVVLFAPLSITNTGSVLAPQLALEPNVANAFVEELFAKMSYAILSIGAWFTILGGQMLELSLELFVLGFGKLLTGGVTATDGSITLGSSDLSAVVDTVWTVVRDISNLLFIFGFLYIGILLIAKNSSDAKRWLAKLIIMALLVNFSLLVTKVVIEFTNLLAFSIYSKMTEGGGTISDSIMSILGLASIYDYTDPDKLERLTGGGLLWFFIMSFILLIITGFVFLAGALMMLTRFVALLFIMMFSPILFAANIFPLTAKYAKDMWMKLFSYSLFAPAYVFLIWVAILVLNGLDIAGNTGYTDLVPKADAQSTDAYVVVLNFAVAIIVIQAAAGLASKMGLAGGQIALNISDRGKNIVRGIGRGMGRGASNLALLGPRAGARWGVNKASNAALERFDKWQVKNKDSRVGRLVAFTNADRPIRETLEKGKQAKVGLKHTVEENRKYRTARDAELKRLESILATSEKLAEHISSGGTVTGPTSNEMKEMVGAIKGLTTEQMKNMDINILTNENVALHLSTKQIDELEKTGKYSDRQINDIRDARKKAVEKISPRGLVGDILVGGQSQRELLAQRGSDELAKMPIVVFTAPAMAPYLTSDIVEAKMKSGVSTKDQGDIRRNIDNEIRKQRAASPGAVSAYEKQWAKWAESSIGARLGLTTV